MTIIKDLANAVSKELLKDQPIPAADIFDPDNFPFGKAAGDNKFGTTSCPTCGKPPMNMSGTSHANAFPNGGFQFRDELSAREYYISGMCQDCQDDIFGASP